MPEPIQPACPLRVSPAVMHQRWDELSFLHWALPAASVQRLLPGGLTADTFGGSAWVGVVPFRMSLRLPALPWAWSFAETNLRTYVFDGDGRRGVWFFSLDASRLLPVAMARATLNLPYQWSDMAVRRSGTLTTYALSRRGPGPCVRTTVEVRRDEPLPSPSALEHFLTARWRLFSRTPVGLVRVDVEHPPWQLWSAQVGQVDTALLEAAGLPAPEGEPLVHWSDGVDVRVGAPRPA